MGICAEIISIGNCMEIRHKLHVQNRIFYVNNDIAVRLFSEDMTFMAHDMINIAQPFSVCGNISNI